MKIYDTLTKEKREFIPINKDKIGFYQCGPTMYWNQHVGNMRSVVLADFFNRTFQYLGYEVNFVRNYTDVGHLSSDSDEGEDKMEKAVKRDKKTPEEIFDFYKQGYLKDTTDLNTLPPTTSPRATAHIQEMIDMVQILLNKEIAYQTELAIYFDISKQDDYTKLSGQKIDELLSGTGHGQVSDSTKKNAGDFSLWFFKAGAHEHALQTWENPFSETQGFPGWHIECSAMSKKYLGETFDIHMGGIEHIPIHHTNEIAQSESTNDKSFVNYWMHNEHLLVDNKKMSKSEGTSYLVSDIVEKGYSPLDLRYFFIQAHYRSKQNFTWEALEASKQARTKLGSKIALLEDSGSINMMYKKQFIDALEADFGLPEALSVVYSVLSSDISDANKKATILDFDAVLGLDLANADLAKSNQLDISALPQNIKDLFNNRELARDNKDWSLSDELRDKLDAAGYEIKDTSGGQELFTK